MMRLAKLAAKLDRSMVTHDFSGVVSIRQSGHILYERATGLADRSNHIQNTLETCFGTASGTKFFTALALVIAMYLPIFKLGAVI